MTTHTDPKMNRDRRVVLKGLGAGCIAWAAALAGASSPAAAQMAGAAAPGGYPGNGRVTIVVPFAPGGATDIIGRLLAEALTKRWGATVTVENKAGAGGGIGTEFVARARPDGLTLLLGTQTGLAVNPVLLPRLGYDVEKDFTPLTLLASTPLVLLASQKSGAKDLKELAALIKARPDGLSYGTSGNGTSQHLTMLMMLNRIGGKAVHVPYKGSSQSLADLAGQQIDMQFDNMATALAFSKTGKARALAVTSLTRSELAPDVPTLAESGLTNFEASTWLGLLAPAGLPEPLQNWLHKEVEAVMTAADFKPRLAEQGFTARTMTPGAFRGFIQAETRRFAELVRVNQVTVN
jgi:tripartite-type tricarboxylate transporter receptor subunit TctC